MSADTPSGLKIVCHRGASEVAPENTLASAKIARTAPKARLMVRRQDFPSLEDALAWAPAVMEFAPDEDPGAFAHCRAAGTAPMIAYMGRDPAQFRRIVQSAPNYANLHCPIAFSTWSGRPPS